MNTRTHACRIGAAVGVAVLLGACTGPPGDDAEPIPRPAGPTATATAAPPTMSSSQRELSEFLSSAGDFVPSTHPGLLVVSPHYFSEVADDGTVDRSRLVPPLPEDHVWKCFTESEAGTAVCLGLGDSRRFEPFPGPPCPSVQLERHRLGRSMVTHRTYAPDGRLTQQITHETYEEHYAVVGSAPGTQGGTDVFVVDDLAPDGAVATRRVVGTESYQHTGDGVLVWVNQGELRIEDPDGDREVTIVSGRWDRLDDPEGARERLCAAFTP
jgi:hypothetical protein